MTSDLTASPLLDVRRKNLAEVLRRNRRPTMNQHTERSSLFDQAFGQDEDPKSAAGHAKVSMEHFPPSIMAEVSEVFRLGSQKYGRFNWLESPKKASVYYEAMERHMAAYWQGETYDPETGLRHAAHAIAGLVILMVQEDLGLLIDDRPKGLPSFSEKAAELLEIRENRKEE